MSRSNQVNPYKFEAFISKLATPVIGPDGKAETAYAVLAGRACLIAKMFNRKAPAEASDDKVVVIVQESRIKKFLEFIKAQDSDFAKYEAFTFPANSLGYLTFHEKEANKFNPAHIFLQKEENTSTFQHVGYALDEYSLRYGLRTGTAGRACNEASWSSHKFHRKCKLSPGNYTDSKEARLQKEKKLDDEIAELAEQQRNAAEKMGKKWNGKVDTEKLGSVNMYRSDPVIQEKMRALGISSAAEALPDSNFLTIDRFLELENIKIKAAQKAQRIGNFIENYKTHGTMEALLQDLNQEAKNAEQKMDVDKKLDIENSPPLMQALIQLANNSGWNEKGVSFFGKAAPTCIDNIRKAKSLEQIIKNADRLPIKPSGWGKRDAATYDLLLLLQALNNKPSFLDYSIALKIIEVFTEKNFAAANASTVKADLSPGTA